MSDPVIDVRGLVKTFGATRALDDLDLSVGPGEVRGFLGPNGAGKPTTPTWWRHRERDIG